MQSFKTVTKFCICLIGIWGLALVGPLGAQASESLTPAQALAKAIETDDAPAALQSIKSGASLVQRDFIGFQPLHYAAFLGKPDMVKLLLDSGAPLNGLAKDSRLALAVAAAEGRLEVVKLLLAAGADPNDARGYNTVYRAKNVTALMEAAASGRTEVISHLIAHGADPNLLDSNRDPALNYAAYTGAVDAAVLLVKSGSVVSMNGFGGTALDLAERQTGGKPELAAYLKTMGAKRAADLGKTSADELMKNITWFASSHLRLAIGGKIIHVDPGLVTQKETADILLFTHSHSDHFNPQSFERLGFPRHYYTGWEQAGAKRLLPWQSIVVDDILIQAVPAYNPEGSPGASYHPKSSNFVGYVITWQGVSVYIAGDTDRIPEMARLKADIAIVPLVRPFTMKSVEEAALAVQDTGAKIGIPIHWGNDQVKANALKFVAALEKNGLKGQILSIQ